MMKKLLAILLVGALLTVGFASCKKKQGNKNTNDPSYEEDDVIVNFARVESVDASGTAQKDEGGQQIYEYFTFESIDVKDFAKEKAFTQRPIDNLILKSVVVNGETIE